LIVVPLTAGPDEDAGRAELEAAERAYPDLDGALDAGDARGLVLSLRLAHRHEL
jgi:hypothetical protein